METKDTTIRLAIGALLIIILTIVAINKPNEVAPQRLGHICKEDSLRNEINNLEAVLDNEEDGWDKKEERYENILFEYEYGLSRIKETHPSAYREFHRIIGYREKYSREVENENNERLKINKNSKW